MKYLLVRFQNLKYIMFGFAFIILNMLVYHFVIENPLDQVDLYVLNNKCIAIDPGHGGIDTGAVWNGIKEKDLNLAISLKLAAHLKQYGVNVVLTRENDTDYYTKGKGGKRNDLLQRVAVIDSSKGDLFISLHLNAMKSSKWSGAQVFYSPKFSQNKILADITQKALLDLSKENKRQAKEDKELLLLNAASLPGVLIEAGFISNPREASLLREEEYQKKLVQQITKAVAYYISQNVER